MERRHRRDGDQETKKEKGGERERGKKGQREKGKGEREKMWGEKKRNGKESKRDCISIITVDWLGLRATSYLLVFAFYITTNLLLISYY